MTSESQLYIEFDGSQLRVRTDVSEVHEYLQALFRHMLVTERRKGDAEFGFFRTATGFAIESGKRMEFDFEVIDSLLPLLKDEIRLQLMQSRPDLLWLHAGAVARNGRALLLSGASGQGKSTLSTMLCGLGWSYMSDDVAPVRMHCDTVLPFPQTAVRRIHPGREVGGDEVHRLEREIIAFPSADVVTAEVPIHAIVFVEYSPGSTTTLVELSKGSAALEVLRHLTNFMDHRAAAVERAVALARKIPVFELRYDSAAGAARLITSRFEQDPAISGEAASRGDP